MNNRTLAALALSGALVAACTAAEPEKKETAAAPAPQPAPRAAAPVAPAAPAAPTPGAMPPLVDPSNVYSETAAGKLRADVAAAPPRVYVPNRRSNDVSVIDPATLQVIDHFKVGFNPQHVVPSWDLKTLWVTNNAERTNKGSLTPIDPLTGKPGKSIPVDDPYNMYFTPDGTAAIVVAEAHRAARFPRSADHGAAVLRSPCRSARASITPTSRSTGATRSSPASSPAGWRRSTSPNARCSAI